MGRHGGRAKQCEIKVTGTNGKTIKCGNPLDSNGKCPTHGRPY